MKSELRKVAAAGLAVIRYLEAEREQMQAAPAAELAPAREPAAEALPGSLWAASGRLSAMQIRNLMQYRIFQKS
ncbi:MAG: hypothetical protein AB1640_06445 [bacterium]